MHLCLINDGRDVMSTEHTLNDGWVFLCSVDSRTWSEMSGTWPGVWGHPDPTLNAWDKRSAPVDQFVGSMQGVIEDSEPGGGKWFPNYSQGEVPDPHLVASMLLEILARHVPVHVG